jgi:hypothetical protein
MCNAFCGWNGGSILVPIPTGPVIGHGKVLLVCAQTRPLIEINPIVKITTMLERLMLFTPKFNLKTSLVTATKV